MHAANTRIGLDWTRSSEGCRTESSHGGRLRQCGRDLKTTCYGKQTVRGAIRFVYRKWLDFLPSPRSRKRVRGNRRAPPLRALCCCIIMDRADSPTPCRLAPPFSSSGLFGRAPALPKTQLRLRLLRWSGFSGGVGAVLENV